MFDTCSRAMCSEGEILLRFLKLYPRLSVDLELRLSSCWQTGCLKMESIDSTQVVVRSAVLHTLVTPDFDVLTLS